MEGNYNWDLGHKFLQQGQALQDTSPNGSHDPTAQKECKVWGRELQCRSIWKTPQAPRVTIPLLRPQTIPWVSRPVNIGEKSSIGQGWWVNLHGILAQAELKAFTLPFCLAMTIYPHSEGNISQVVRNLASHLMWEKSLEYPACQQQRQMPIPDTSPFSGDTDWLPSGGFLLCGPSSHKDMALHCAHSRYGFASRFCSGSVSTIVSSHPKYFIHTHGISYNIASVRGLFVSFMKKKKGQ